MSIIGWILLGLIAGFIGSKIVNSEGQGLWLNIVLGIVGAVVGGFLFSIFGATGITGFNIYSLIVAIIGSVVVLWLYHQLVGRRRIWRSQPGRWMNSSSAGVTNGKSRRRHLRRSFRRKHCQAAYDRAVGPVGLGRAVQERRHPTTGYKAPAEPQQ